MSHDSPPGPLRIGLIGCGRIAQVAHLPAAEKTESVEIMALCDPSADVAGAVAQRFNISICTTDPQAILNDPRVEAVLISTPDRFHVQLSELALRAGKHVLVEKPLATSSSEAITLVKLAAESGLKVQIGAMKRHDAGIEFARSYINTKLGDVRSFSAWYRVGDLRSGIEATLFPRLYVDAAAHAREAIVKSDRARYLLTTHGAHLFDTIRHLLGDVRTVQAHHRVDGDDHTWLITMVLDSGAIGTATLIADAPGESAEGIFVLGSAGTVCVDTWGPFQRSASSVRAYSSGDGVVMVPVLTDGDAFKRQLEAFARSIRMDTITNPTATDGLAAIQLIEAATTSCLTHQEVTMEIISYQPDWP